jgi:hypothetical protein
MTERGVRPLLIILKLLIPSFVKEGQGGFKNEILKQVQDDESGKSSSLLTEYA